MVHIAVENIFSLLIKPFKLFYFPLIINWKAKAHFKLFLLCMKTNQLEVNESWLSIIQSNLMVSQKKKKNIDKEDGDIGQ